jgi:hypothetical protein
MPLKAAITFEEGGCREDCVVDEADDGDQHLVCAHTQLNSVRAKILTPGARMEDCPWSRLSRLLKIPGKCPPWLGDDRPPGKHGIREDRAAGRQEFSQRTKARRADEKPETEAWRKLSHL